ncbi:transglycosylase SLT domain-containing protein [Nonomuraea sp. GTA35]|uniref:transglycosylase SLT domain-containing protein n=1 Tax=Nonomuraea sp. GTA35 TaxID=1676746 RepID=UPI0035C0A50B
MNILTPVDISDLPRGGELSGLLQKVTGRPQAIRDIASAWRACSFRAADITSALIRYVNDVDLKWEGDSADAFDRHIRLYPKAGEEFNAAVRACAQTLDNIANTMESAHASVDALCKGAITSATAHIKDYMEKNGTDQTTATVALAGNASMTSLMNTNIDLARGHVKTAEDAVVAARDTLSQHVKAGGSGQSTSFGFFTGIPDPGGADFDPGDKKVIWTRTPVDQTQVASGGGAGAGGGTSPGAGTPAPKAEVVEWIKQALTIIRSPEMADTMRERGIDVSDLDANDPKDVERIWTIIYHESGGNPNAINNWDINAKNGVPSQGLMQTIPPTFNAHSLPGHGKILDPVDNIIAGVLYTYSRYGNLGGHPGIASLERGGGYRPY